MPNSNGPKITFAPIKVEASSGSWGGTTTTVLDGNNYFDYVYSQPSTAKLANHQWVLSDRPRANVEKQPKRGKPMPEHVANTLRKLSDLRAEHDRRAHGYHESYHVNNPIVEPDMLANIRNKVDAGHTASAAASAIGRKTRRLQRIYGQEKRA